MKQIEMQTSDQAVQLLTEMNRHIEELLKLKAPEILLQSAANDRLSMISPDFIYSENRLKQKTWWGNFCSAVVVAR